MNTRKIAFWITVLVIAMFIGIAINKENVALPYHMLPHLAVFGLFKDSQKMKAIDRRIIRHKRDMATRSLFKTMIYIVVLLSLIGLAFSVAGQ
jgi:hypothetical protein